MHGRRTWALERQVRLVAGSLVLVGLGAGRYLSPRARLLTTGVGAGLTFSALSDTCAMGRLLSRLPINQATPEPTCHREPHPARRRHRFEVPEAMTMALTAVLAAVFGLVIGALLGLVAAAAGASSSSPPWSTAWDCR